MSQDPANHTRIPHAIPEHHLPTGHSGHLSPAAHHWADYHRLSAKEREFVDHLTRKGQTAVGELAAVLGHAENEALELIERLADKGWLHKTRLGEAIQVRLRRAHAARHQEADRADEDFTGLKKHLLKNVLIYCRFRVLAVIFGYLVQVLLARHMGAEDFGFYSIVLSTGVLLSYLAGLGFPTSVERFLPVYIAEGEWGKAKGMVNRAQQLTLATGVALVLAALPFIFLSDRLDRPHAILFAAGMLLTPLLGLTNVTTSVMQAEKKFKASFFIDLFLPPLLMLIFFGSMTFLYHDLTAAHGVTAVLLVHAVILAFLLYKFWTSLPEEYRTAKAVYRTAKWVKASLPILLMTGFVIIVYRVDLFIVGAILGSKQAGIYAAALAASDMLAMFLKASDAVANPEIAPLFKRRDFKNLNRLMGLVAALAFWPTLIAGAAMVVFGKQILGMFGAGFEAGHTVLILLIVCRLIKAWSGAPGYLLIMTGNQMKLVTNYSALVVVDVALVALLTWKLGLAGAAAASAISMLFSRIWLVHTARKYTEVNTALFGRRPAQTG